MVEPSYEALLRYNKLLQDQCLRYESALKKAQKLMSSAYANVRQIEVKPLDQMEKLFDQ